MIQRQRGELRAGDGRPRRHGSAWASLLLLLTAAGRASAQDLSESRQIGFGLAFTDSLKLKHVEHYGRESALASLRWSTPLHGDGAWPHLRLAVEPTVGTFFAPRGGVIFGVNTALRYYPRTSGRFLPFLGLGGGVMWTSFQLLEEPFNFTLFPEVGLDFFLNKRTSLLVGYRMYHISNGGLRLPNIGINANLATVGLSWTY